MLLQFIAIFKKSKDVERILHVAHVTNVQPEMLTTTNVFLLHRKPGSYRILPLAGSHSRLECRNAAVLRLVFIENFPFQFPDAEMTFGFLLHEVGQVGGLRHLAGYGRTGPRIQKDPKGTKDASRQCVAIGFGLDG